MPAPRKEDCSVLLWLSLLLLLGQLGYLPGCAGVLPSLGPSFACKRKIEAIEAEVARLGSAHDWAGVYRKGGLTHRTLHIAPESGFAEVRGGCTGFYGEGLGDVLVGDGHLELGGFLGLFSPPGLAGAIIPIRWGDAHFLVPESKLAAFADDIYEHQSFGGFSAYYTRLGDSPPPYLSPPEVATRHAEAFEDLYVIEAHIVELLPVESEPEPSDGLLSARALLDVGLRDGVREEVGFGRPGEGAWRGIVYISSVDEHTSVADLWFEQDEPPPEVGWTLTRLERRTTEQD